MKQRSGKMDFYVFFNRVLILVVRNKLPEIKVGGLLSLSLTSSVTSISVVLGSVPESDAVAFRRNM